MASSFITKNKIHGFWVQDSIMQVVCWGMVQIIDKTALDNQNYWMKTKLREHVFNNSQGIFVGFMHLSLSDFLTNKVRRKMFIEIVRKTKDFFRDKGDHILIEEPNRQIKIDVKLLSKILDLLIDVANDKLNTVVQIAEI